jgi:hypothetical protein
MLLPLSRNGARAVHRGLERDGGEEIGYLSGSVTSASGDELELWMKLDPEKLLKILQEDVAKHG